LKYKNAKEYFWVQEEPENMGAWSFMMRMFGNVPIKFIGRHESATPATGFAKVHAEQQQSIVNSIFSNVKVVSN